MFKWIIRGVLAGIIFAVAWLAIGYIVEGLKRSSLFTVGSVEVHGVFRTDMKRLEDVYKPMVGKNIFADITQQQLMSNDPWIRRIEIKRVLPNKLLIIIEEEEEILHYSWKKRCFIRTKSNIDIPSICTDNVKVDVVEALPEEFKAFIELYKDNDVLRSGKVTLKKGFFTLELDNISFLGSFAPEVFMDNYKIYKRDIEKRYKVINHVDMTIEGRIFVRGV